ncbi:trafficking protein particle complex subunit 8 [Dendroctonus ponderosae]|uniref:Trafficking protein particle complex subunit 8 n=2 Tax=Dendroctonus ponderosae TaxID=77166 RepID=A0AAR5PVF3_DENPD|nr:trafficking protein particle complex subunit 8 [Dendroctonus ponderosae]
MAQCKLSPQEFIKDAFTPQVAAMCTPGVQRCCDKNNLDFIEILEPFSTLTNDVTYKDPTGSAVTVKNLKLTFVDVNARPPQTTLARKLLNSSVIETLEPEMKSLTVNNFQLEVLSFTPWFENWRDTFFRVQYPSDHEFTKHFLACLLIVSSTDNNMIETMHQLVQNLNRMQSVPETMPKWFTVNVLKYYIILHDNVEGDISIANEGFNVLKTQYGSSNCFLLRINSRTPGLEKVEHLPDPWSQFLNSRIDLKNYQLSPSSSPDPKRHDSFEIGQEANETRNITYHPLSPELENILTDMQFEKEEPMIKQNTEKWRHGGCLSANDVEQIKTMLNEFVKVCLLPYIEKHLSLLHDAATNKKGVSKSLLSATKRWFGSGKPNSNSLAANNLTYSVDAPELQIRRLGDLYFMFGNYSAAFQAYHTAKRDYNADQAWLYYAGALEMAALSAFMANESSRKTYDYMEESIATYLTTCKLPQFATRATILSSECLKAKQLYGETAHQLIRMTSEDSDLRSALFLEQASCCFIQSNMLRKYAFHMVLSGHRFFKAAQKKHSLRCYKQAYQIYEKTGWDLASDHIHYTIGRLANHLQIFDEAVKSFAKLLNGESKQSGLQQGIFLKEYLTILELKRKDDGLNELPILPVPELNNAVIKVLVGPARPLSTPGKVPALGIHFTGCENSTVEERWHKLEELLLSEESGKAPVVFKPVVTLRTARSTDTNTLLAIINEPIQVSIQLINSLQTVLQLKDLYLIWCYENDKKSVTNLESNDDVDKYMKTYVTKSVVIQGNSRQDLILSLTPVATGDVFLSGICYCLTASGDNTDAVSVKGKQLFKVSNRESYCSVQPIYLKILPFAPCLQMTFSEINLDFLAGQMQRVSVDFQNTGSVSLKNIMIATSVPHLLSNCELKTNQLEYAIGSDDTPHNKGKKARKNHITTIPLPSGQLESGQSISFYIWVKAPPVKGPSSIDLLAYYENVDSQRIPKYRLIRHTWNLSVQESITVDISTQNSYTSTTAEDLALALKTTNLNQIHNSISTEITLLNIALLSNNWVLTQDIVTPKYINLKAQESAHILIKARRKVSKSCKQTNLSLNSEKTTLPHLSTAFQAFARKSHVPELNIFELNSENDKREGTLILEWRALVCDASNRRIVYGHTCVPIEINRKEHHLETLISESIIDLNSLTTHESDYLYTSQNLVTYNLFYSAVVRHNFKKKVSCVVPITLVIHSVADKKITITISTIASSMVSCNTHNRSTKSCLTSSQATSNFSWLTNGKVVRILEPLTTIAVKLSAIIANPGTFDLGANLLVFCNSLVHDDVPVLQRNQATSSLIVIDGGS